MNSSRETRRERSEFARIARAEREFATRLRGVARRVGEIIRGFLRAGEEPDPETLQLIESELRRYSETIGPWAQAVATRMLADVSRRDETAWRTLARRMGHVMYREITSAPTGRILREAMARQVDLIKSIPLEAAQRVHQVAIAKLATGERAGEIKYPHRPPPGLAKDILDTGHVTVSRANLIARTETHRASTELTAARAEFVGSTHFIWRTARDADVRPMHRKLEGTVHRWNEPPVAEVGGQRHLPGAFPNCRCWAEPVLPEKIV